MMHHLQYFGDVKHNEHISIQPACTMELDRRRQKGRRGNLVLDSCGVYARVCTVKMALFIKRSLGMVTTIKLPFWCKAFRNIYMDHGAIFHCKYYL